MLPEFYAPEAVANFHRVFRTGLAASVSAIVLDVALLMVLAALFERDETMMVLSVALFLFIMGAAVAVIVFLGMVQSKYNLKQYMESAAEVLRGAGLEVPDEADTK